MKLFSIAALALVATAPALAASTSFFVDFEKNWDYANGDVAGYYGGGTAADGSSGPNQGVSFVGVSGLSNDADFTYYSGAPSMQGTAYVYDTAYMNVAGGVSNGLAFAYSSPEDLIGAVEAWSDADGTGVLLGSFDLAATGSYDADGFYSYDSWRQVVFAFDGLAQSFVLTGMANVAALDDIHADLQAVPEPVSALLVLTACVGLGVSRRRPG
jgi:hypothetical protein